MTVEDEEELSESVGRTLLGFNPLQESHTNCINIEHPESSARISRIRTIVQDCQLIDKCHVIEEFPSIDELDLQATHSEDYVSKIFTKSDVTNQDELNECCAEYDSVFMSPGSVLAAQQGVSCCRTLAEMIMEQKAPNGVAVVRPPGHHADSSSASGFCLFNNAAQAAEAAFNFGADRILIVDLDVHHGQGTQRIFYEDKRVLYLSVHRFEKGKYWPHLKESNFDFIGDGPGRGYNVNVPLNETGCGDSDYLSIFWNVIWPLAVEFDPHFVIVSAGFDSCRGDPLGEMDLTPDCYSHIIYQLQALAEGKLLMVLEGGYNHEVSAVALQRCLRVLTKSYPFALEELNTPKESTITSCLNVISVLRNFWTCFDFYNVRAGTRSLPWDVHNSDADFCPPSDEDRSNTENVSQQELLSIDWQHEGIKSACSTLLAFNREDELHCDVVDDDHPEKPGRTREIMRRLTSEGLKSKCLVLENDRLASEQELEAAHDRPYVQRIKRTAAMTDDELRIEEKKLDSIFLTRDSFEVARRAAGAVLECVDRVFSEPAGDLNAFAVVRPPGHHAGLSKPSGFCLFNNVAIAAQYARKKYGAKRVLILDWDVHHGNGTQEIFYEDDSVLYMSVHRHEGGLFYPMGEAKDFSDVGEGPGQGRSVNIPFSGGKMGDAEYRAAFSKIIMPIAYEFNPDLVFISAGFDAARGDPLGEYKVQPETFALMTHQLCGLAGGRTIAVLEGGYNLDSISACAAAVCETMLNRRMTRRIKEELEQFASVKPRLHPDAWVTLRRAAQIQAKYWKCLKGYQINGVHEFGPVVYSDSSSEDEEEMSESASTSKERPNEITGLHAVVPLTHCPHLVEVAEVPSAGIDAKSTCRSCGNAREPWVCLTCYMVHCGRHVYEHALLHHVYSTHSMVLSLADLSAWCYTCDSYVHNEILTPAKSAAYFSKFGESMPNA